jgi:hypothetical protein
MNNVMGSLKAVEMPKISRTDPKPEEFLLNGDCPQVEVVGELSSFSEYADMSNTQPGSLVSQVIIARAQNSCEYSPKSVTIDLKLDFAGVLGPQGRALGERPFFSYPFFVAVTGPRGAILAKEVFAATMTYEPGQDQQSYHESLRQIIPMPDRAKGKNHKVLIGFQLTPEQLEFNRAVIRQRQAEADALKAAQEQAAKAQAAAQ